MSEPHTRRNALVLLSPMSRDPDHRHAKGVGPEKDFSAEEPVLGVVDVERFQPDSEEGRQDRLRNELYRRKENRAPLLASTNQLRPGGGRGRTIEASLPGVNVANETVVRPDRI